MAENRPIDRLILYLEYKKISFSVAEKTLGVANAYIQNSKNRKGEIGSAILSKIKSEYLDINLIWLITGEGQMIAPEKELKKITYTPSDESQNNILSEPDFTNSVSPKKGKYVSPTVSPTHNLGHPHVVTVSEKDEELVTLVNVKAAAGYLNGYGDPEYIETLPTIRMPGLKGGTHRAFEVKGHSMSPTLHNSSIVVGKWIETIEDIRDRRIYVIVTKHDGILVKRVLNRLSDTGKLILISDNQNKKEYPNIILSAEDIAELWYLRAGLMFEFPEPNEFYNRFNDLEATVTLLADKVKKLST